MNPFAIAARGKGFWNMLRRTTVIGRRYGLTARNMDRTLQRFAEILDEYEAKATFPITGAALARSNGFAKKFQSARIEFAAHGYYHVDHVQLSLADQAKQFDTVSRLFAARSMIPHGFRCPYLRWSDETVTAIKHAGFAYDSSQALAWDVEDSVVTEAYRRVLQFYGALPASAYPALPRWDKGLVRIPYCLPDDEALIDRLSFKTATDLDRIWPDILVETYRLGELFTLGLHPERLDLCKTPLVTTLQLARRLSPRVWCARLDEVTYWWKSRTEAKVTITERDEGHIHISVEGPDGVTVLVRSVETTADSTAWAGPYRRLQGLEFGLWANKRPFIGVSPTSAPYLTSFLRQQGYIVETAQAGGSHTIYLHRPQFTYEDERALLVQIEQGEAPLVRLGRWPHGARSALCITGDIDALTIWDYGLRFLGN